MNRSLRSKKNLAPAPKKSVGEDWTKGEDFAFNISRSPTRRKSRRETMVGTKPDVKEKIQTRRRTFYLKRLDIDEIVSPKSSPRPRLMRERQSASSVCKVVSVVRKREVGNLSRAKSEKAISKKSPKDKVQKIKENLKVTDTSKAAASASDSVPKLNTENFYKSAVETQQGSTRRLSMSRVVLTKIDSPVEQTDTGKHKTSKQYQQSKLVEKRPEKQRKILSPKQIKENLSKMSLRTSPKQSKTTSKHDDDIQIKTRKNMASKQPKNTRSSKQTDKIPSPKYTDKSPSSKGTDRIQSSKQRKKTHSPTVTDARWSPNRTDKRRSSNRINKVQSSKQTDKLQSSKQSEVTESRKLRKRSLSPDQTQSEPSSSLKRQNVSTTSNITPSRKQNKSSSSLQKLNKNSHSESKLLTPTNPTNNEKYTPKWKSSKTKKKTVSSAIKKPVKRLSVQTPSPAQLKGRRLTRSVARKVEKKVHIFAESPAIHEQYRKTPASSNKIQNLKSESPVFKKESLQIRQLKPFTPKLEEPSKLLKETLKKNAATEIEALKKKETLCLMRPSIASVRTSTKSVSSRIHFTPRSQHDVYEASIAKDLNETPVRNGKEGSHTVSFSVPSTPLSSRKASASFRRFRGSSRLDGGFSDRCSTLDESSEKPISSTPVKDKERDGNSFLEEGQLMNISEVSSNGDSKLAPSLTQSFGNNSSIEDVTEISDKRNDKEVDRQQSKRGYCNLM